MPDYVLLGPLGATSLDQGGIQLHATAPDRYLVNPGDTALDFRQWITGFGNYIHLLNLKIALN